MSTSKSAKRQSPRSDKELLLETMIEAADDALFLQRGAADEDETTIEFGHNDEDLLSFDHPMLDLKRNLDQDFCDSSTDSYWEDEKKSSAGPKWDVTLANSVEVLKSHLRESSESSRWTGKTVPESPKFHEIKPRPLPKSTQEQEEEEMQQIQPFQARKPPPFTKPNLETKPAPVTTPQPFHFHSTTRKRSVPPSKEQVDLQECQQFRFKARPIPKSVQSTKSPEVSRIPRLSLPSAPQKSAARFPRSLQPVAPKMATKPSRIPGSTSKVEKICVEMEIKTMRVEFHMTSDAGNESSDTRKEARQPTLRKVVPPKLNCLERHEAFKQKQAEKLREEEKKNRQKACFKARPLPASLQKRRVVPQCPDGPEVIARIPKSPPRLPITSSSKLVEETKAAAEDDLFFDAEQFVPKASGGVVRLIQITSTVVILSFIVWYGTSPNYFWHSHRQFRDKTDSSATFNGKPQVTYESENVSLAKATENVQPFAAPINEEAPRAEDVSLILKSDASSKYVLNVAENDVAFHRSFDTAENTGLEAQRGIQAQDSVERRRFSDEDNDVSAKITKAEAVRAKAEHYFEGLIPEGPESIQRASLKRTTSKNTTAHVGGPKKPFEDEDHAHDRTMNHPEGSEKIQVEVEPVRRKVYFDFLQGFVTPDVSRSNERKIRPKRSAGSDYHVQRWLDLSIDEMVVLNGVFGVRFDSSFQRDVYRLE
jgi:hypothetical protein